MPTVRVTERVMKEGIKVGWEGWNTILYSQGPITPGIRELRDVVKFVWDESNFMNQDGCWCWFFHSRHRSYHLSLFLVTYYKSSDLVRWVRVGWLVGILGLRRRGSHARRRYSGYWDGLLAFGSHPPVHLGQTVSNPLPFKHPTSCSFDSKSTVMGLSKFHFFTPFSPPSHLKLPHYTDAN